MVNQKINELQGKEIAESYSKGHSTVMLARQFHVQPITIRRWLSKNNINRRTSEEAGRLASIEGRLFGQHKIPDSSREITKDKAYILGVMCGDGYLHKAKHSYQIGLQATDKDFVAEFAKCIDIVYEIKPQLKMLPRKHINWNNQWRARICSKAVFNDILNYGIFKTYNWCIPDEIFRSSNEIKARFLQGFFDSEGSIDPGERRINAVSVNLIGINQIKDLLKSLNINSTVKSRKKSVGNRKILHSVNIQDRKSSELYMKLIGFNIQRKQKSALNSINSYKLWMCTEEEMKQISPLIQKLRDENLTYEEIGKRLGIGVATAWNYCKRKNTKG